MASLIAARAAKDSLRQKLQGVPWLRGIGITQTKCMSPDPYEVQINVDTRSTFDALLACPQTPRLWMGVPISFSVTGNITALGDDVTKQDAANVLAGALCAVGMFFVGKIAVENIIQSRKEHFESKGQTKEAVKAKESTADGLIKLVGFALSAYELQQELPGLLADAKALLK